MSSAVQKPIQCVGGWGEMWSFAGIVLAAGVLDWGVEGVEGVEVGFELRAAEVLVADQRQELAG